MNWALNVDAIRASFVTGRLRNKSNGDRSTPVVDLWIDDVFDRTEKLDAEDPEPIEFRIPLPNFCFDGQQHQIEIRCDGQIHSQQFESEYDGFIDPFSENLISGWAIDRSRPGTPVALEIHLNGMAVAHTIANLHRDDLRESIGFQYRLRKTAEMDRSFVLLARIAGTDIDLQGSPVLSVARPRLVKAAQQLNTAFHYLEQRLMWAGKGLGPELHLSTEERHIFADLLLQDSSVADILELQHRFLRPIQQQLTERYARRDYSTLGSHYPQSIPRRARDSHRDRPVDVIVPVYAGLNETQRCLNSLLRATNGCRYQLICVLDNPAAGDLRALLRGLAESDKRIVLVENEASVGFAESVNRAMMLHRDRDVVILQADCEVHGDWLLRLQNAAYEGAGAGMVNPLTDRAEFLSYPAWGIDLPDDAPFDRLDDIAKRLGNQTGAVRTIPIPAAMGFCLYIRRGCLDDLGFFHNDVPSGGYYAEKYFSVNAAAQGWRTILATNVFVKHRGFVSFAERDANAIEMARDAFELWCPFYADSVTDFLVDDPSLPVKRELDIARLMALNREFFCLVTHGGGGGTEKHLQDLSQGLAIDGVSSLLLFALPDRRIMLTANSLVGVENLKYRMDQDFERLIHDLKRLRVSHFHIHSNVDVPRELFELPARLGVPYDITIHDYAWFCPRVTLVNHSGEYCGEPPVEVCETCTGGAVARLRDLSQADLAGARRVFCPSEDTRDRVQRQFGLANVAVRAHPEWIGTPEWRTEDAAPGEVIRVAAIGRLSGHKGLRVLRECAAHALEWALPLQFVVIGYTSGDDQFSRLTNVEITGPYSEDDVENMIERLGIRVALLASVWPETYSYTLSIALRCGLPAVAFDLGAVAERLRRTGTGILLPLGTGAARINEALLEAGRMHTPTPEAHGTGYFNMLQDYYELP